MELSVLERLLILNLNTLPATGSIVTLKVKQQLLNDVGFSERELKDYNIRQKGENVQWSPDAPLSDIEIGEQGKKLLIDAMEKSESLTENYLFLYDRLKA